MEQQTLDMFLCLNFISPWSATLHVIDFFCCRQVCKAWRQALTKKEQDQLVRDNLKEYTIKYAREFCLGLEQLAARHTGNARIETVTQSITIKWLPDRYRTLLDNAGQPLYPRQFWESRGMYIPIALDTFPYLRGNQLGFSAISFKIDPGVRLHALFLIGDQIVFEFHSDPTDQERTLRHDLFEMPLVFTQGRFRHHNFSVSSTTPFTLHIVEEPINAAHTLSDSIYYLTRSAFIPQFGFCNLYRNMPSAGTGGIMWHIKPTAD